jgi:hypothetical protein
MAVQNAFRLLLLVVGLAVSGLLEPTISGAEEAPGSQASSPGDTAAPPVPKPAVRLDREPVREDFAGARTYRTVQGHRLAFGERSYTATQRAHPRQELPRTHRAREWRSPWCTLWRDGCERCEWSLEDGRVSCFAMTGETAGCKRTDVVCEAVEFDLLGSDCAQWSDGCNTCQIQGSRKSGFTTPCSAMWCSPQAYYRNGLSCEVTRVACEARPGDPSCSLTAASQFRAAKRSQARALLKALERP